MWISKMTRHKLVSISQKKPLKILQWIFSLTFMLMVRQIETWLMGENILFRSLSHENQDWPIFYLHPIPTANWQLAVLTWFQHDWLFKHPMLMLCCPVRVWDVIVREWVCNVIFGQETCPVWRGVWNSSK